ncbi:MAG: hypothetical protein WED00_11535 [Aquisalimonadaceae bacterium]
MTLWDLDAYVLFRSDLTGAAAPWSQHDDITDGLVIRELDGTNETDVHNLAKLTYPHQTNEERRGQLSRLSTQLGNGERCFVAVAETDIVAMQWIAGPKSAVFKGFGAMLRNAAKRSLFHRTFVREDFRGRKLQRRIDSYMKKTLKNEGIETTYTFVGVRNFASIINCLRLNNEFRLIYHLSIDLPGLPKLNLYPKRSREPWRPCRLGE